MIASDRARAFITRLLEDKTFRDELHLKWGKNTLPDTRALTALARDMGYRFSAGDLGTDVFALFEKLAANYGYQTGAGASEELSDDELALIVGGIGHIPANAYTNQD